MQPIGENKCLGDLSITKYAKVYYFAILIANDLPVLSIEFYLMETFDKTNTELLATLSSVFMTLLDLSACAVVMYRKAMPPVTF